MNVESSFACNSCMNSSFSKSGGTLWFSSVTMAGTFNPLPTGGAFFLSLYTDTRPVRSISTISRNVDNPEMSVRSTGSLNAILP